MTSSQPVSIHPVTDERELSDFIRFQRKLLRQYPGYAPPLERQERRNLALNDHPFKESVVQQLFLARRGATVVGRISAHINRMHFSHEDNPGARFGWIDFENDPEVSAALLQSAEHWAREQGATVIRGPLGYTALDPSGMITRGFDHIGGFTTIFNPAYYPEHLQEAGYKPEAEWAQYELSIPPQLAERVIKIAETIQNRFQLRVSYPKSRQEIEEIGSKMMQTYQEAFKRIYQAVPLTPSQQQHYIQNLSRFFTTDLSCMITNEHNQVVAFALTVPSLADALRKAGGYLFPFGWWHLSRAFKQNDTVEMLIIGVHPDYQAKGVTALLFKELWTNFIQRGFKRALGNPELVTNTSVVNLWHAYERKETVRRKTFLKALR